MIDIASADPLSPDSQRLIGQLSAALTAITGSSGKGSFDIDDLQSERALWVLAYDEQGNVVGCGAIRPLSGQTAELKRLFATQAGSGVGSAVLCYLEEAASALGYQEIKLETRRVNRRAVSFYQKHGYAQTDNYGAYVGRTEAVCFVKRL